MTKRHIQLIKFTGDTAVTCLKRKISSKREAKSQLKKARRIGMRSFYHCPTCDSWHLTSNRDYKVTKKGVYRGSVKSKHRTKRVQSDKN